jgi:hypothetical protein
MFALLRVRLTPSTGAALKRRSTGMPWEVELRKGKEKQSDEKSYLSIL